MDDIGRLRWRNSAQNQDGQTNPRLSELNSLIGRGNGYTGCTGLFYRERDGNKAMPVGIRLYNDKDRGFRSE
jgi:hypothetical protein